MGFQDLTAERIYRTALREGSKLIQSTAERNATALLSYIEHKLCEIRIL